MKKVLIVALAFGVSSTALAQMQNFSRTQRSTQNQQYRFNQTGQNARATNTQQMQNNVSQSGTGSPMGGFGGFMNRGGQAQMPSQTQIPDLSGLQGQIPDLSSLLGGAGGGQIPDLSSLLGGAGGGQIPDLSGLLGGAGGGQIPDLSGLLGGAGGAQIPDLSGIMNGGQMPDLSNLFANFQIPDLSQISGGNSQLPDLSQIGQGQIPNIELPQNMDQSFQCVQDAADKIEAASADVETCLQNLEASSQSQQPDQAQVQACLTKLQDVTGQNSGLMGCFGN